MRLTIKNGQLYVDGYLASSILAHQIARTNDFSKAETFAREYEGQTLVLDSACKIKKNSKQFAVRSM